MSPYRSLPTVLNSAMTRGKSDLKEEEENMTAVDFLNIELWLLVNRSGQRVLPEVLCILQADGDAIVGRILPWDHDEVRDKDEDEYLPCCFDCLQICWGICPGQEDGRLSLWGVVHYVPGGMACRKHLYQLHTLVRADLLY